jgi:hypothetical protein
VLDGRQFLTATTGLAATLAFRSPLLAQLEKAPATPPDHSLVDENEDAYRAELRQPFLIPGDEIYLNNGTVGSSPAPVLRPIFDGHNTTEKMDQQDPEDYPIWGYAAGNEFRDRWPHSWARTTTRSRRVGCSISQPVSSMQFGINVRGTPSLQELSQCVYQAE